MGLTMTKLKFNCDKECDDCVVRFRCLTQRHLMLGVGDLEKIIAYTSKKQGDEDAKV